jgi:fucose 4-O-acetylase-like acetyltransferase
MEPSAAPAPSISIRQAHLDNLRSFVIFLVVVMHSNVTYSGMGSWYYVEGRADSLDIVSRVVFGLYGSFTQAWFMGLLFFLAAYFAARSLARRGAKAFIAERLFRLGVPLLAYVLLINPFIGYFLVNHQGIRDRCGPLEAWLGYLSNGGWAGGTGPLWFVEALLLLCLPYALWRRWRPAKAAETAAPGNRALVLLMLAAGLAACCLRLAWPIGSSVANLQLGFFASYLALFGLGIHAGERGWLDAFPARRGLRWFAAGVAGGLAAWAALMVAGGALGGDIPIYGGLHWQSFAYALWEAFVAIGLSIGMVAFFRRFLSGDNRLTRLLAANSFGVYLFHAPVLTGLSLLLASWPAPPLAKHLAVAPLAYAATLLLSCLALKRIPGLRLILK